MKWTEPTKSLQPDIKTTWSNNILILKSLPTASLGGEGRSLGPAAASSSSVDISNCLHT